MNFNRRTQIRGNLHAIPSKSYLIRALLLATLSTKTTKIYGLYMSNDILNTLDAIKALGATYTIVDDTIEVTPPKTLNDNIVFNVGECATLLRLIVPILGVFGISATISAEGSLLKRDIFDSFIDIKNSGISVSDSFPIRVSGLLQTKDFVITNYTTSGIVSGLMIALTQCGGSITLDKTKINKGYNNITKEIIEGFSGKIVEMDSGYAIEKSNLLVDDYIVEGDYSNVAPFFAIGAIMGEMSVTNLNIKSEQRDRRMLDILLKMGAKISAKDNTITIRHDELTAVDIDMSKNLDIIPILSVVASEAFGTSVFRNVNNLALKESNRIDEIVRLLKAFGKSAEYKDGALYICGGFGHSGDYVAPQDHRLIMAASILLLKYGGSIENTDSINKSYPTFFDDIEKL